MIKLTEKEKQALQLIIDNASDIDEDEGIITYFSTFRSDVDEKQVPGFRGLCSSLKQKDIIDIVDNCYVSVENIPIDENGKVKFDEDLDMEEEKKVLVEAPDDDGIMSDDELDAQEKAERDEFEARLKARRDAVAKQRADRDAKVAREAELKAQAEEKVKELGNDWSFEHLFDVLVPNNGKCDSAAGELIRAVNKIEYRWFNDGDKCNEGYGIETCGPAMYFIANFEHEDENPFWDTIFDIDMYDDDTEYEIWIEKLKNSVIEYIKGHPELLAEETTDMLDINKSDVRDWLEEQDLLMTFDYDLDMPDELRAHLDKGNISDTDIEWEVEGYSNGTVYVYEDDGYISFENLSRDERNEIESNGYHWLEQYADSLTDEFGDPYAEDEEESEEDEEEE